MLMIKYFDRRLKLLLYFILIQMLLSLLAVVFWYPSSISSYEYLKDVSSSLLKNGNGRLNPIQSNFGVQATVNQPAFNKSGKIVISFGSNTSHIIVVAIRNIPRDSIPNCGEFNVAELSQNSAESKVKPQLLLKCNQTLNNQVRVFKVNKPLYEIIFNAPTLEYKSLASETRLALIPAVPKLNNNACPLEYPRLLSDASISDVCIHPYTKVTLQFIKDSRIYKSLLTNFAHREKLNTKTLAITVVVLLLVLIFLLPICIVLVQRRYKKPDENDANNKNSQYTGVPLEEV